MPEQLQTRLDKLKKEYQSGQEELEKVVQRETYLREIMLRISGAIQILEELIAEDQRTPRNGSRIADPRLDSVDTTTEHHNE